jgi:acyl-CoA thioester hydrolase
VRRRAELCDLRHITRIRVRYGETDQMGVVYHANYLVYFEVGRTELIRERGFSYAELEREGVRLPVVEAAVRFRGPARYDDLLVLETRLVEVGAARLRFDYRLRLGEGDHLLAEGHTVLASVDPQGRPRRLPERLRRALEGAAGSAAGK